ncbi:hypothetical protein GQ53DRAFT_745364 [Thozetella sp. PMI_491]|nr:hypothetical protein GQ53DRAFT_745364 [Thozetella sp. PMI_491]
MSQTDPVTSLTGGRPKVIRAGPTAISALSRTGPQVALEAACTGQSQVTHLRRIASKAEYKVVATGGESASKTAGPQPQRRPYGEISPEELPFPVSLDWPLYRGQSMDPASRLLEQDLWHRYFYRLGQQDLSEYGVAKLFLKSNATLAFEYPFMAYIFLSHGAAKPPDKRRTPQLGATLLTYLNRSIAGQLAEVRTGINISNFPALFATSNLIACQTIEARAFASPNIAGVVDWLKCWRGVGHFVTAAVEFMPLAYWPKISQFPALSLPRNDPLFAFLLQGCPRMSTPRHRYTAYQDVIAFLTLMYRTPDRTLYTRFLTETPNTFVKCVGQCESTALLLMATYFALSRVIDVPFDWDESGEVDLLLIQGYLPRMHRRLLDRAIDLIGDRSSRSTLNDT